MGITHKITQCNIFKCVMNASKNSIQILGYQISLNKSPYIEFFLLWRLERSDLQGRFYHAKQTPQHTQGKDTHAYRWKENQNRVELWQCWQQKGFYLQIILLLQVRINRNVITNELGLIWKCSHNKKSAAKSFGKVHMWNKNQWETLVWGKIMQNG